MNGRPARTEATRTDEVRTDGVRTDGPRAATRALERRGYELELLNDIARTLNASIDLPTLLRRALEKVAELLDLDAGWVLLFDDTTAEPYMAAALNLPPGLEREPARMTGWCHCLESYRRGDLSAAANVGLVACSRLRELMRASGDTAGLHYHASVPLAVSCHDGISGDAAAGSADECRRLYGELARDGVKRLGMLNVASHEWRRLRDDELRLLRTVGDMLSVAIERARLHARRLEGAQTEERNRLAREIHDTIAQDFSAIAFQLETAEALLAGGAGPERMRAAITAALDLTRKGLEETRRSVLDLRAAPLEGRTLAQALAALADESERPDGPAVVFETSAPIGSLPPAVELGLYRIAGEAVQNALRHAEASRIALRLDRLEGAPGGVRLTVEDDGRGFDTESVCDERNEGRFGLLGMCERARLLGARIDLETEPGVGTRIAVEVDLDV